MECMPSRSDSHIVRINRLVTAVMALMLAVGLLWGVCRSEHLTRSDLYGAVCLLFVVPGYWFLVRRWAATPDARNPGRRTVCILGLVFLFGAVSLWLVAIIW